MKRGAHFFVISIMLGPFGACSNAEMPADDAQMLLGTAQIHFASEDEGRAFLTTEDDYIRAQGPADRLLRFGDENASYIEVADAARGTWNDEQTQRVTGAIAYVHKRFEALGIALPFPAEILLVRSSGAEEGYIGGYTRANGIVFPDVVFEDSDDYLTFFVAHELFHVASRFEPAMRDPVYAIFGFHPCADRHSPPDLDLIEVTNPDAFHFSHCIEVSAEEDTFLAVVVMSANEISPNAQSPLESLDVNLLAVSPDGEALRREDGGLRFYDLREVTGYFEQIGANTDYIIHPEEISAENFALLVMNADDLPNPELLVAMREAITP